MKTFSPAGIGCLIFVLGMLGGCVAGFNWAREQTYVSPTGHEYRGDARGMMVIGRAMLGGLLGGVAASAVAFLWRRRSAAKERARNEEKR